ncbi:Retrovirus-related Pol polyprotein from type-1 retrotransposable element R1 2 [Eumeta japonica]|uniref:Retrovirus-related Pol polyprotein from type-1 retrotransposable element R1 2 n=1 Tax=Eumeta variegata TaxID=151549 RepID=A0A4C2A2H4_EUMVA|nr:Retrovirus-related Pol polyprotein from type-1 retrotransposable element R1 2 [Eumeta japonica]
MSGHCCFQAYLHRFKHDDSPECPSCPGVNEDAEHAFFECPLFSQKREILKMVLNQNIQPETIVDTMLSSEASWNTTSTFAGSPIDLRSIERRRANDSD